MNPRDAVPTEFEGLARAHGLSAQETHVVRLVRGIEHGPMGLREVADIFGITHQRVAQIEEEVIRKLRWRLR